ncbi:MAG: translocation/assembly module TamB domain-containing protein, partial [Flavobacteriales bacterium]|nr:translocation/assembly module TamB domain-containing protein [Flavobacteriales bacterium]
MIDPYLSVKIYENDTISNLDIFINKFKAPKDTIKASTDLGLISTGVNVKNLTFLYQDLRPKKKQNFELTNLDLVVSDIIANSEDIHFSIDELNFDINNKFKLKSLTGDFIYSPTYTQIEKLHIVSEHSEIKSNLKITYPSFHHVIKKSPKVKLDFSISPSTISLREINYFVPFTDSRGNVRLSMKAKGNIDRMQVSEFKMRTSKHTEINAKMDLYNILSKNNFDFNLRLYRLSSNYSDLIEILPKKLQKTVPPLVAKLGEFDITGKVKFKYNYLNSNLDFETEIGELKSDIEISVKDSIENADYKGEIKVRNFDLKHFLGNEHLGLAELDINIEGKGLSLEKLDSYVEGNITTLDFNNYKYHNIHVKGDVKDRLFKGGLDVKDDNIAVSFSGLVDLRSSTPKYNFEAYIDNADLVKTNLFTRDSLAFLEGSVNVNLEGKTVEDLVGTIGLSNIVYQNENDLYYFDEFNVSSTKDEMHHKVVITSSDIVSGELEGDFYFYDVPKMFENALGSFFNNYSEVDIVEGQNIDFQITFKDKIIEIFYPSVNFKSGTSVLGSLDSESNHLQFKFNSDGISFDENTIDSITLWVDNKSDFYSALLKIKQVQTKSYSIHDLNLATVNKLDSLELTTDFYGGDSLTEKYNFKLYHTIDEESNLVFGFLNSQMNFMDNTWVINPENNKSSKVVYNPKTKAVEIDSIFIANHNQSILIHGHKDELEQKYFAHVENVVLKDLIKEDAKFKFLGVMNADLAVSVEGDDVKPVANLSIDSLSFNSNYMGDLIVDMRSASNNGVYSTDVSLFRDDINTLNATGVVDLSGDTPSLDIDANLEKLKLKFINQFTKKLFSDIRGYASGKVKVSGPLNNPDLNGYLDLQRAGIAIDYLKVNLNIEGKQRVYVKDHLITVPSATLRDSEDGTTGT